MSGFIKTIASSYNELIFSLVLYLRQLGMNFMSVNILNGVILIIMLLIAYQMFQTAKKAVIYLILMAIIMLPFLFLIISSFFINNSNINDFVR
jgi:uncharacterized membrane protein